MLHHRKKAAIFYQISIFVFEGAFNLLDFPQTHDLACFNDGTRRAKGAPPLTTRTASTPTHGPPNHDPAFPSCFCSPGSNTFFGGKRVPPIRTAPPSPQALQEGEPSYKPKRTKATAAAQARATTTRSATGVRRANAGTMSMASAPPTAPPKCPLTEMPGTSSV